MRFGKRRPHGRRLYGLGSYWVLHSGTGFLGPALLARFPATSTPMPRQRSQAPLWAASLAGAATGAACADGLVWVDPPGCTGGFGRFVISDVPAFAFGPPLTWTPATEAGCVLELDGVAAAPQAAVSNADATRRTWSLLIALGITQRPGLANGLDAA